MDRAQTRQERLEAANERLRELRALATMAATADIGLPEGFRPAHTRAYSPKARSERL